MTTNSAIIQSLKTVKEKIGSNYTSGQLFSVLDKMLYRAVDPLIRHTRFIDRALAIVLAWYAQNHRRRISNHSKKKFTVHVIAFLASADPDVRCKLYRKMKLERNITFFLVQHWLRIIGPWRELHVQACRGLLHRQQERELLIQCCVTDIGPIWGVIGTAQYWLDNAASFKHRMIEKYMRLVMVEAHTHWKMQRQNNPHLQLDLEETAQNFLLAVIKAIDKFDASQGTLTSYVKDWFKNARITMQHRGEYGIAYSIPHSKKTSIATKQDGITRNISVNLDSPEAQEVEADNNIEQRIQHTQELTRVRTIAKASDPSGVGRLLLGIPEVLNDSELRLLLTAQLPKEA